ncbi:hypothetical protein LOK49_LG01G00462 [Camellia lanceoleosa]|uniref:Uncharacterized protein n=1 Tax=Camellia lanceoleosa TaxID=1840588 RepID=A0ACC0IVE6_9ERIC|nr:hypothetical protein LOK49_LG01G00462 [Camellia lanceoleosa]
MSPKLASSASTMASLAAAPPSLAEVIEKAAFQRDAAIKEKLGSVKDTSAEVKQLEEQAAAVMRAARAEISASSSSPLKMPGPGPDRPSNRLRRPLGGFSADLQHSPDLIITLHSFKKQKPKIRKKKNTFCSNLKIFI